MLFLRDLNEMQRFCEPAIYATQPQLRCEMVHASLVTTRCRIVALFNSIFNNNYLNVCGWLLILNATLHTMYVLNPTRKSLEINWG